MNSVSWFIYIAQVCGSLGALFILLGALTMACVAACFALPRINAAIECKPLPTTPIKKGYLALGIFFLVAGNLLPEKNTMYAIAAAEVGERIIKDETVRGVTGDATKALQQWIKKQIEPETKK